MRMREKKELLSVLAVFVVLVTATAGCAASFAPGRESRAVAEDISEGSAKGAGPSKTDGAEAAGEVPAAAEDMGREREDGYAFGTLSQEARRLYLEILEAVTGFDRDVQLPTLDPECIGPVLDCVLADHPEIFYVDGYTCTEHTLGEELVKITFSARYTLTEEQVRERQEEIDEAVRQILSGLDEGLDDYGKLKYLYDRIIGHTDYDKDAKENQTICSVFLYGRSVCQGYAKAFQYLCDQIRIPAVMISGTVGSGDGHAWDLVCCDGSWYYVDPTWGDAYYQMGEDDPAWQSQERPEVNYDYFLVTTEQLARTHTIREKFVLPACDSLKDNYYVREGAYFDRMDRERLAALFRESYAKGKGILTLKCSDDAVYEEMKRALLDDQEIFDYLEKDVSTVAYVDSSEQCTLTFWL